MVTREVLAPWLQFREVRQEWEVWEHKTLNMHRGVLYWRPVNREMSFPEMAARVRERVALTYKKSWWRGLAFGAWIDLETMPPGIDKMIEPIDTLATGKAVWQWTVVTCNTQRVALGVHTWKDVYLSPAFREILARYEGAGWTVGKFKKEMDSLNKFLASIARMKGAKPAEFEY